MFQPPLSDPGQQFRDKANKGDVAGMLLIYTECKKNGSPFMITERGQLSGKSAADRAAEKGHAHVLRFLYNLGDDLTSAQALASNDECKQIFELITLGKHAVEAAHHIFPHKIDIQTATLEADEILQAFRAQTRTVAEQKNRESMSELMHQVKADPSLTNVTALFAISMFFMRLHDHCQTLAVAREHKYDAGACDENSVAGYVSLIHEAKNKFCVDQLQITYEGGGDHMFVGLNRDASSPFTAAHGWKKMLLVDPFQGRCFFYEHLDQVEDAFISKNLRPNSKQLTLCCSSHTESVLPLGLKPQTIQVMKKMHKEIECQAAQHFTQQSGLASVKNKFSN